MTGDDVTGKDVMSGTRGRAMNKGGINDPKGLIFESYRMEGISKPECRTIFLDWALSIPVEQDTRQALMGLLGEYSDSFPDHPMTQVVQEGLHAMAAPRRRGGWRSRARTPDA